MAADYNGFTAPKIDMRTEDTEAIGVLREILATNQQILAVLRIIRDERA